jgi:hypothetical protein
MNNSVKKALSERRLMFFSNGKYKYIPSKEYLDKFKGNGEKKADAYLPSLKEVANKLNRLEKAFEVAKREGKRVSHVHNGKIVLAG